MTNGLEFEYAYRLISAPESRNDGSGCINHDIWKIYRVAGSGQPWGEAADVLGLHETFVVPASDMMIVMDMPDSNASEKQAKNTAYKEMLKANKNTTPDPLASWDDDECTEALNNNAMSVTESARANEYITVTLGQVYPVEFVL